jgi:metal-responsive CopG/Arc/MetJ family transcriptional regulator
MKNLSIAISDDADQKLDQIMQAKHFKNRADAIEYLIQTVFKQEVQS